MRSRDVPAEGSKHSSTSLDRDAVCAVLGLAFADNPNTLAMAGGDPDKARRITEAGIRVVKLDRKYSNLWVAAHAGRIVGALNAVEWPRCQLGAGEKLRTAPGMIRAMGSGLPRAFKLMGVWARRDPRERHWHLGPIGVHPELQGQGIGKAMLGSFLGLVDEQGSAAYLETDRDRNVTLYAQFGFNVIGQEDILGATNWFMWREAGVRTS